MKALKNDLFQDYPSLIIAEKKSHLYHHSLPFIMVSNQECDLQLMAIMEIDFHKPFIGK